MPTRVALALGLCVLTPGRAVFAQDTAPPASSPTIRTSVQEVVLDMVVRDSKGRLVKNLKPGDVSIYEDGVKQDIQSFRFVSGREAASSKDAAAPAPVAATPSSNPLGAVNLICLVFHNLDPLNKKNAMDAAADFLKSNLPPNAWIAAFSLDTRLSVLQAFTQDRAELIKAESRAFTGPEMDFMSAANAVLSATPNIITVDETVNGTPGKGGTVSASPVMHGGELNPRAINGAEVSDSAASNAMRGDLASQRRQFGAIRGMQAMDQLEDMIGQLSALPGRKTVVLFSPGLATTGDADLFKSVLDKANRADIGFYAVDINGLAENSNGLASSAELSHTAALSAEQGAKAGGAADSMERMRQSDYNLQAVRTSDTQASLRALSEGTGGFLTGSTNDYRKSFERLVEDVDTHYEAVYKPSSNNYDGHLRTIEVKLARSGLNVQSRTGYFAMPYLGETQRQPFEMRGLGALSLAKRPHAFNFESAALPFRPGGGATESAVVFQIATRNLGAAPQPSTKTHLIRPAIFALVKDAHGQVVDKFSQDSPYEIADANLAAAANSTVQFTHSFHLPPGHYTVDTAILDQETNRVSTGMLAFDNPQPKSVGLSGIVLVQRLENLKGRADASDPFQFQTGPEQKRQVVPELAAVVKPGGHPYVYFVAYPDKAVAEKPKLHVEFSVDGKLLAQQTADLPAADATGAVPMVVGAAAQPGKCELKVTLVQGSASVEQSLSYAVQ